MKLVTLWILILVIFFVSSISVLAETKTNDAIKAKQQLVLLQEINRLLLEVQKLQVLLKEKTVSTSGQPYQSVFFDRPYEGIYLVYGTKLKSATRSDFIRPIDHELFKLLIDTIGEEAVSEWVKEWRVFYDEEEDLGGFVEQIAGTNNWIFGVNRAEYETKDLNNIRSFANLFIHEYAHLLLSNQPEFTKNYTKQFWTIADKRHQVYAGRVDEEKRFTTLAKYFEANTNRFVSDYATISPDEDMAESFVVFVREDKGKMANTLRSNKINIFYDVPEFVSVRSTLRNNLEELGVLD